MTVESSSGGDPEDLDGEPKPVEGRRLHYAGDHQSDPDLAGDRCLCGAGDGLNAKTDPGDNSLTGE